MRALEAMPERVCRSVSCVLTDIDDTVSTRGQITAEAYTALERLSDAGIAVVPVTGRPAGWCDFIARMWPVAAVVGENGAFYFKSDVQRRALIRWYAQDAETRGRQRARLGELRSAILHAVPGAAVASDQAYRESDLAIDYCEDVAPLSSSDVDRIVAIAHDNGATVKVSSIHVNIWFGHFDKLTTTEMMLRDVVGLEMASAQDSLLFVGDSPNDEPMFRAMRNAVGVSNVARFLANMTHRPSYLTTRAFGAGFAEVAARILSVRHAAAKA